MTAPVPDETMTRIVAAIELSRTGRRAEARRLLTAIWQETGPAGDPLHRCSVAHYLADLQETAEAELTWDELALAAVADLTDERAARYHADLQVRGFLPSLHLNLADDHRRLARPDLAREHLETAERLSAHLPDDGYGAMVRAGIRHVTEALAAGSTARLPSHP